MNKEIDIEKINRVVSGNYDEEDLRYFENLLLDDSKFKLLEKYLNKHWKDLNKNQINNLIDEGKIKDILYEIRNRIDNYEIGKAEKFYHKFIGIYNKVAMILLPIIMIISIVIISKNRLSRQEEFLEIKTNKGSKTNFVLPDGTAGWLNSNSVILYSTNFKDSRRIFLTGEALFNVKHIKNKPLYVETKDIKIKVIGTRFNVKAYPEDKSIVTTLIKGKLEIETLNSRKGREKVYLKSNQKFIYNKDYIKEKTEIKKDEKSYDRIFVLKINRVENLEYDTAWIANKLIFKNEPFGSLVVMLERWYNVEIKLIDSALFNYSYTGSFENETIEQALTALRLANPIFDYRIDKNKIEIFSSMKIKK